MLRLEGAFGTGLLQQYLAGCLPYINEELVAYCEREHLTFTRGRPEVKNDQCHIEQKNGAVVRRFVGHDRLVGEQAFQQLRELYRALRLYINCFQPSMKLLSKTSREDDQQIRRIYDPAKTPLQRLLLSGALPPSTQEELGAIAQALNPVRLLAQITQLQRAVWHWAVSAPLFSCPPSDRAVLRFAVHRCLSSSVPTLGGGRESVVFPDVPSPVGDRPFLNWRRSSTNPFAPEGERLLAWVQAHPEWSVRTLFEELEHLFPGRYTLAQYPALQRAVRKIRAHLRKQAEDSWPLEIIYGPVLDVPASESSEHQGLQSPNERAGSPIRMFLSPARMTYPTLLRRCLSTPPVLSVTESYARSVFKNVKLPLMEFPHIRRHGCSDNTGHSILCEGILARIGVNSLLVFFFTW